MKTRGFGCCSRLGRLSSLFELSLTSAKLHVSVTWSFFPLSIYTDFTYGAPWVPPDIQATNLMLYTKEISKTTNIIIIAFIIAIAKVSLKNPNDDHSDQPPSRDSPFRFLGFSCLFRFSGFKLTERCFCSFLTLPRSTS